MIMETAVKIKVFSLSDNSEVDIMDIDFDYMTDTVEILIQ